MEVSNQAWRTEHFKTLLQNYANASHFKEYRDAVESLYLNCTSTNLSKINKQFIELLCGFLGIKTKISNFYESNFGFEKNQRLIEVLKANNATTYLSGPAAKSYIDTNQFRDAGIDVFWMDYSDYPEYEQLYPPFSHSVSVLDLIFNQGERSGRYMKSFDTDWLEYLYSEERLAN